MYDVDSYLTSVYKADAGIMISASHNPFEYNGIKIFGEDGFKLSDELEELIRIQKMRGDANVKLALIEKHTRLALPFSAFILTIMGVALSSKKKRGGIGWNIGIGIALAFTYILFLRFSQMFVHTDTLPPAIALWLPNVVFTTIAVFLYRIAPK